MLAQTVMNILQRSALVSRLRGQPRWPYRTYLVLKHLKLVYCPIPKVASGNLKRWFLLESHIPRTAWCEDRVDGIHTYVHQRFGLQDLSVLHDRSYYKVALVRNPFARLVSAFLDKCVRPLAAQQQDPRRRPLQSHAVHHSPAYPSLCALTRMHEHRSLAAVTFTEWVRLLCRLPDCALDAHWLPQTRFLDRVAFDLIAPMENLDRAFAEIQRTVGTRTPLRILKKRQRYAEHAQTGPAVGAHCSSSQAPTATCAGDLSISALSARKRFPAYPAFYDAQTQTLVAQRYRADFARFGYRPSIRTTVA